MPDREILSEGFDAFEVTVTVPLAFPVAVGLNVTEKEVVWPAASVRGAVMPLRLKAAPLTET